MKPQSIRDKGKTIEAARDKRQTTHRETIRLTADFSMMTVEIRRPNGINSFQC